MKKLLLLVASMTLLVVLLSPSLLGFSLLHIGHAVEMSTNMTAKLACSNKFISKFDNELIIKDLASYSPVIKLVNVDYDEQNLTVTADMFGFSPALAKYRPGVGCSLSRSEHEPMQNIRLAKLKPATELWPAGEDGANTAPLIQQKAEQILRSDNEKGYQTRALLVVKDGELLAEAYGPGMDKDSYLLGWSMAKSVTAMLLGILEKDGKVRAEQSQLFTQWQGDERSQLTVEDLLRMTSGLEFDETYAPGSDATRMLFTADSASDVALASPLTAPPGEYFSYSSGTTNILSRLISELYDNDPQRVQNFVKQSLFEPLAMSHSVFEMDTSGVMVGSSYLYASARDWARLGWLMVNRGEINGTRVLDRDWVMRAQQVNSSKNDPRYGYQFWLNRGQEQLRWPSLPNDAFAMLGNRKQSVMMIPSKNTVLVRLGWSSGNYPMEQNYRALLDELSTATSH